MMMTIRNIKKIFYVCRRKGAGAEFVDQFSRDRGTWRRDVLPKQHLSTYRLNEIKKRTDDKIRLITYSASIDRDNDKLARVTETGSNHQMGDRFHPIVVDFRRDIERCSVGNHGGNGSPLHSPRRARRSQSTCTTLRSAEPEDQLCRVLV